MLVFPLNSEYLRKEYYKAGREKLESHRKGHFPKLETSNDIYFLFQTVIFEEIRSFDPSFIIVSYNGFLGLSEEHWNEIVKNLTIIADHKVSLFVDFIDKLGSKANSFQDEDDEDGEERGDVQDDVEEGGDLLEPHELLHDEEVPAGRYGKEFGYALEEPEEGGL